MGRYSQSYVGERRTRSIGIKVTPAERAELEAAAKEAGKQLSTFVRELCVNRSTISPEEMLRGADVKALLYELRAIGNNVNQLAWHANAKYELPAHETLKAAMAELKAALARILELSP